MHRLGGQTELLPPARWLRSLATLVTLVLSLLIFAEDADARLEGELSFAGAFLSPSVDYSGLGIMAAFDDSMPAYAAQPSSPGGTLVGLFSRPGLVGGFSAGFLGAGLLGVLFGQGVAGGLTGVASVLGLIFQLALVLMLARLIWTWWRGDKAAAFAKLSPRELADAYGRTRHETLPDVDSPATAGGDTGAPSSDAVNQRDRP